jgi:deoxyribose-phosphate aldolase
MTDQTEAQRIARLIDHTLLKPEATPDQVIQLCQEARTYGFAAVCVNPIYVPLAVEQLAGSESVACAVCGFPLGATPTPFKVFEAQATVEAGAAEIDMVIAIGLLKAGQHDAVREDIAAVAQAVHARGATLKVIIEAAALTDDEKRIACQLAQGAGADFVKTSTGFGPGGATVEDVRLMRQVVGPAMGIKAAGGIRNLEQTLAMVNAGATRIGTSAGVKIVEEVLRGTTL